MAFNKPVVESVDPHEELESVAASGGGRSVALIAALTFLGYYIGAELAFSLRIPSTRSSIIWIPNAVLLTVLLSTAPRHWFIWLLAALPAHVFAQSRHDGAVVIVLAPFVANVVQATLAALAWRYFSSAPPRFDTLRETALFVSIAVLLVPGLVSLAAGWGFVLVGWENDVWLVSRGRFLNNVITGLTIAPLILLALAGLQRRDWQPKPERCLEFFALVFILVVVLYLTHHWTPKENQNFPIQLYAPLPFLLWAAFRFGMSGLAVALLGVALHSISGTINGDGPYVSQSPAENILALQLALAVLAIPLMLLASAVSERRKKDEALRQSEERYRSVVDDQTELVCRYLPDTTLTFVNAAYARYFGRSPDELIGTSFLALIPEQQRERAKLHLSSVVENPEIGSQEHEVLTPGGEVRWQHWVDQPIRDPYGRVTEFQGVGRDVTDRKRAESRLRLQYAVTHILTEADSMAAAAPRILQAVCEILGWDLGEIWRLEGDRSLLICDGSWHLPQAELAAFADASRRFTFSLGIGLPGRAWQSRKPVWILEVGQSDYFKRIALAAHADLHSAFAVPITAGSEATFVLSFFSRQVRRLDNELLDTMGNIGDQIGQFIGRRRAEYLVRESEKLLRQKDEQLTRTQRFSAVMVTHTSLEGRWLKVPPTFCELLGYTEDELLGRRFHECTHPDDVDAYWNQCLRLIRGEINSVDIEKRFFRKDGTVVWVNLDVSIVTDADGNPVHFLTYVRDISRRKLAEDALRKSEAKFSGIIAIAAEAIISVDEAHKITLFNEGAEKIFGYAKAEVLGRPLDVLLPERFRRGHGAHLGEFTGALMAVYPMGERQEIFGLRKNGEEFPSEASISQLSLEGQKLFNIVLRDITERKHAEETLKSALDEVRRLKERLEAENVVLRAEVSGGHADVKILGQSDVLQAVLRQIEQVARTDMNVLILGETGTGKELVARAVHQRSARRGHPLVKVNCAALPETLIESELFGHEKGAFTGAGARRMGRFEIADGGSIFLDEIGELPLRLQAKLLRVLQEGEFERLGSGKTIKANVRIIAATNRNLSEAMQKGSFRSDLYYRLAVYPIRVPALRERKEDIDLLTERFLLEAGQRLGKTFDGVPPEVLKALRSYDWPGNVRELQNVLERAAVVSAGALLQLPDEWMQATVMRKPLYDSPGPIDGSTRMANPPERDLTLEDLERAHILRILRETRWRIDGPKGAALILGLRPSTLRSRMSKLGISRSYNS